MKKLKLKKWVKNVLGVLLLIVLAIIVEQTVTYSINEFNERAAKCDALKGYTCSLYDIQNMRGNYE